MKIKRSTAIPLILIAYLAVMAYIGYDEYAAGKTSPLMYFGVIAATLVIITLLHFNLKYREARRKQQQQEQNK